MIFYTCIIPADTVDITKRCVENKIWFKGDFKLVVATMTVAKTISFNADFRLKTLVKMQMLAT